MSSVQLLDKTRKIGKLLHNNNSGKVVFNDICSVLREILASNVLVISRKGKILGVGNLAGAAAAGELLEEPIRSEVGSFIDPLLNERLLSVLSTKENVNLATLGFEGADVKRFAAVVSPIEIAGERLGYVAVSPKVEGAQELLGALILCNRILGFVNAPALAQQILDRCMESQVDLEIYRKRREAMAKILRDAGVEFTMPGGAFYAFANVSSTGMDGQKFARGLLAAEKVAVVPGDAFGDAGKDYIRLSYATSLRTLTEAVKRMKRFLDKE